MCPGKPLRVYADHRNLFHLFNRAFTPLDEIWPMMSAMNLIELARDASPEARADLVAATADQLLNDPDETPQATLEQYGVVLAKLYPFARQDVRERLSAALAMADWAPPQLVQEIARDNEEVALQVISFCPALADEGLVEIVRTCGLEHRKTVAGRENISEAVSHELVTLEDRRVLEPLIENSTARLADEDFKAALDFVAGDAELHDALAARRDLPASLVAFAYATASDETRRAIEARLPGQLASRMARLATIVGDARGTADAAAEETGAGAGPLRALPSPGALLALLLRGDRRGFLRGVVAITEVSGPTLHKRMSPPEVELVTLVAKSCGFEQDAVATIMDAFRPGVAWSRADDRMVALNWMRHSKQTARKALQATLAA